MNFAQKTMENTEKEFRVYVDFSYRIYSKPIKADSLEEALERFSEQGFRMRGEFEQDDSFDYDAEEIRSGVGAKEFIWDEEYEDWEEGDCIVD